MYLALRSAASPDADATPPSVALGSTPADAGVTKPKRKRQRAQRNAAAGERGWGNEAAVDESEPQRVTLSQADRAMEWRGDDTSRPPQKIDMADSADARSLDDGEIRATLDAQSEPVRNCVIAGAANTDLVGTITVKWVVSGQGRVSKTKVHAFRYLFEHGLLECIRRAAQQMRFPATGASTLVIVPIQLS